MSSLSKCRRNLVKFDVFSEEFDQTLNAFQQRQFSEFEETFLTQQTYFALAYISQF